MNNIKKFDEFINEESDYRNVTGTGSGDQQNSGPSFNKGPYSATYRLPTVIGVETDEFEDPYFGQDREQRRKRIKKNPHIEKNRKDKAKYFDKMDKKTQNKVIEH